MGNIWERPFDEKYILKNLLGAGLVSLPFSFSKMCAWFLVRSLFWCQFRNTGTYSCQLISPITTSAFDRLAKQIDVPPLQFKSWYLHHFWRQNMDRQLVEWGREGAPGRTGFPGHWVGHTVRVGFSCGRLNVSTLSSMLKRARIQTHAHRHTHNENRCNLHLQFCH